MTTTLRALGTLLLVCLLATASPAQILWQQEMGTATQDETSTAFLAVPGGFVHVGQGGNNQQVSFPNQVYLSKVSATGTIAWQKSTSFATRNVKVLYPLGAAADATGQVYVANQCFPITLVPPQASNYSFGLLVKFSATGDTLWSKVLRGLTQSAYTKVVVTADGGAVVIGQNDSNQFVTKFSASGQTLWQRTYLYSSTIPGSLQNIVKTPTGFLVVNSPNGPGLPKYLLLDDLGLFLSDKPAALFYPYYLTTDLNNDILAGAGRFYKISSAGDTLWSRRYMQFGRNVDIRLAVPIPGTNNYLLAGTRYNLLDYDLSLLLVDQNGTRLRDTLLLRYGGSEYPTGLHFDAQGNYIVGGYTDAGGPIGKADQFAFLLRSWNRLLPTKSSATALVGYALYPNPATATERVRVSMPQGSDYGGAYELRDGLGRVVQTGPSLPAGGLPMGELPAGLYLLRLREGERWLPALRLAHN